MNESVVISRESARTKIGSKLNSCGMDPWTRAPKIDYQIFVNIHWRLSHITANSGSNVSIISVSTGDLSSHSYRSHLGHFDARIFKISFFGPKNFEKIFRQRLTHFRSCEHTQNVSIFGDPLYIKWFCVFLWFSKSFISLTDQIKPSGSDSTSSSIKLIFSALTYIEPNFMMIQTRIWFDHPCRHKNDFLIFRFNIKNP